MKNRYILILLLVFTLIFSSEAVFAQHATITVTIEPQELHAGDQVCIHTTIENTGDVDFSNVLVDIPWPNGLKFQYLYGTNKNGEPINQANWVGEVWSAGNMRANSNGQQKHLYIYGTVLPELEGHTITVTARYLQLVYNNGTNYVDMADSVHSAAPNTAKILTSHNSESDKGNNTGNGNGTGNSTGNGNGTGSDLTDVNGNSKLTRMINNLTQSGTKNPLLDLQEGGGGNGKAYEITNATNKSPKTPENTLYGLLGALIIITLVAVGYFKGIRKN